MIDIFTNFIVAVAAQVAATYLYRIYKAEL